MLIVSKMAQPYESERKYISQPSEPNSCSIRNDQSQSV